MIRSLSSKLGPGKLALIVIAAVALTGFVISPAVGGPGFLTKKKANKLYLKKSAAKNFLQRSEANGLLSRSEADGRYFTKTETDGRFYDRGQSDARYYSRAEADSKFVQAGNPIRVATGPSEWVPGTLLSGTVTPKTSNFIDALEVRSEAVASQALFMTPSLPTTLYGRPLKLTGVELCYHAGANAVLQSVALALVSQGTGIAGDIDEVVVDTTARTDQACRTYTVSSPAPIAPDEYPLLRAIANFPNATTASLRLGRATFLFES